MKNAWDPLMANLVGGVAQQRAVVLFDFGGVGQHAGGTTSGDVGRRDVYRIGGIVESPSEYDVRRIGVHLARYLRPFLLRDAVYSRLVWPARRCI